MYYFGGWRNPPEPTLTGWPSDVWSNDAATNWHMADYPGRHPQGGDYNENQQSVIDDQLAMAQTYGVDAFIVNWYRDEYLSHAANLMASSVSDSTTKYALMWSNHYLDSEMLPYNWGFLLEGVRRAALRMSSSRYWRKGELPVFVMYSTRQIVRAIAREYGHDEATYTPTISERQDAIYRIQAVIANVLSGDSSGGIVNPGDYSVTSSATGIGAVGCHLVLCDSDPGAWMLNGVHALTRYNTTDVPVQLFPDGRKQAHTADELTECLNQYLTVNIPSISINTAGQYWTNLTIGWDRRPYGGTADDPARDGATVTAKSLADRIKLIKRTARMYPGSINTVTVYAWNEFGEGGYMAPTVEWGESIALQVQTLKSGSPDDGT